MKLRAVGMKQARSRPKVDAPQCLERKSVVLFTLIIKMGTLWTLLCTSACSKTSSSRSAMLSITGRKLLEKLDALGRFWREDSACWEGYYF